MLGLSRPQACRRIVGPAPQASQVGLFDGRPALYQPPHFAETRPEVLHGLIRAHPLGLLISIGPDGPVADPVPFLLDTDFAPAGRLRAHVARANPHWKLLSQNPEAPVLVVFQGPDAYITPSWYETKRETGKVVPTWNYVIVQARGFATVQDRGDWIGEQIFDLTTAHEGKRDAPWAVGDAPDRYIEAQMRGIVGIEIRITDMTGKWKVSQNRSTADQDGVVLGLDREADNADARAMAGLVRAAGK